MPKNYEHLVVIRLMSCLTLKKWNGG